MFTARCYKPRGDDLNLVFVKDNVVKVFDGIVIPDFCYVLRYSDYIGPCEKVSSYVISDRILTATPDWKQLGMMIPGYKLTDIKMIVRSAFPVHALKFDKVRIKSGKVIDAVDWAEVEWQVKIPSISSVEYYGLNRSKLLPDGQKLTIAINPIFGENLVNLPVPRILAPQDARLLSVTYQLNDGKPHHGIIFMKFIVPPKPDEPKSK